MSEWPLLLDAAGNEIAVGTCECGRPRLSGYRYCCLGCSAIGERRLEQHHSSACNMRCATLGVPGFGVAATDAWSFAARPVGETQRGRATRLAKEAAQQNRRARERSGAIP